MEFPCFVLELKEHTGSEKAEIFYFQCENSSSSLDGMYLDLLGLFTIAKSTLSHVFGYFSRTFNILPP